MARFAATRVLPAPREEVWALLADPRAFGAWWPGAGEVDAGRRGLVPGARWQLSPPAQRREPLVPFSSRARATAVLGPLLVVEVKTPERVQFQLVNDRIDVDLQLQADGEEQTAGILIVEAPFLRVRRALPARALARLERLVLLARS